MKAQPIGPAAITEAIAILEAWPKERLAPQGVNIERCCDEVDRYCPALVLISAWRRRRLMPTGLDVKIAEIYDAPPAVEPAEALERVLAYLRGLLS